MHSNLFEVSQCSTHVHFYLYFIFAMFHHHVDSCLYFNKSGRCHFSPLSSDEGLSPKIPPNRLLWKPPNFLTKKIETFFACVSICLIALRDPVVTKLISNWFTVYVNICIQDVPLFKWVIWCSIEESVIVRRLVAVVGLSSGDKSWQRVWANTTNPIHKSRNISSF